CLAVSITTRSSVTFTLRYDLPGLPLGRSDPGGRIDRCGGNRNPIPRDLRLRLRRVEERRVLPGGAEGPRDAAVLRLPVPVRGDQLHLPPPPLREDAAAVAGADPGRVRVHPEGAPDHHPPAAAGRRR